MRKIPENLENPIDNMIYLTTEKVSVLLKRLNFTPNMITTLSAFFGLLSIYLICKEKFVLGGVMYFISYYFDCVDGYYARKYDMVTEFGDYYDHVKDVVVVIGIIWVLIYKRLYSGLFFLVPVIILMLAHFGCQEIYYGKQDESTSLRMLKKMCPAENKKSSLEAVMRFTRWFGCGTFALLFSVYVASYQFTR